MIFVSPDGERSMNTYLGAGADFDEGDVPSGGHRRALAVPRRVSLRQAQGERRRLGAAADHCGAGGGGVGITLSDPFCVDRHRADFRT